MRKTESVESVVREGFLGLANCIQHLGDVLVAHRSSFKGYQARFDFDIVDQTGLSLYAVLVTNGNISFLQEISKFAVVVESAALRVEQLL